MTSPARARPISPTTARRLAVSAQLLAGPERPGDRAGILDVVRRLGCLQLDPISVVAKSHLLVLASRLGAYDPRDVDALLYEERALFEYWAHAASIVLAEDYAIHAALMRKYRARRAPGRTSALRRDILRRLRAEGPLPARAFEERSGRPRRPTGWSAWGDLERTLYGLWTEGRIVVAGRDGRGRVWAMAEGHFPPDVRRQRLTDRAVVRRAAERAIRALGVARAADVRRHFIRGRYPGLPQALADLERGGRIVPVEIRDGGAAPWPGPGYVHADDLTLLERLEKGDWEPRTALLSPFDNLICDRTRTELLFGMRYRMEIYVPPRLRRYGYYVMPVLHGDTIVARVDPAFDRASRVLDVRAVHPEPGFERSREARLAVGGAVERLASFLGARDVRVPRSARAARR